MPKSLALSAIALLSALGLAGCNATQQPSASLQAAAPDNGAPPNFNLPAGAACTAAVNRYATIVYADNQTGMVSSSVFDEIKVEIADAADTCRAGHDPEARAEIAASKHKHGYPT